MSPLQQFEKASKIGAVVFNAALVGVEIYRLFRSNGQARGPEPTPTPTEPT